MRYVGRGPQKVSEQEEEKGAQGMRGSQREGGRGGSAALGEAGT